MSEGFDAAAFAAKMSSIGHAGSMGGGGGGHASEEHTFQVGMSAPLQTLADQGMAGFVGAYLLTRGLLEAGCPLGSIDRVTGYLFSILPPTTVAALPHPGSAVFSRGGGH